MSDTGTLDTSLDAKLAELENHISAGFQSPLLLPRISSDAQSKLNVDAHSHNPPPISNAVSPRLAASKDYLKDFKGYLNQKAIRQLKRSSLFSKKGSTGNIFNQESTPSASLDQFYSPHSQHPRASMEKRSDLGADDQKLDPIERERRNYLERNKSVELAVLKVKRKMRFENHESKFDKRMSAFSGVTTYLDIGEFISKLGQTNPAKKKKGAKPNKKKKVKLIEQEVVVQQCLPSPRDNIEDTSMIVHEDYEKNEDYFKKEDQTSPSKKLRESKSDGDLHNGLHESVRLAIERLRKQRLRKKPEYQFNEDVCIDHFDDDLEEKLANNEFDLHVGDAHHLTDEAAIMQLEMLKRMLNSRNRIDPTDVTAKKEHLQSFKNRSEKVITLLKKASKNIYNRDTSSNTRIFPTIPTLAPPQSLKSLTSLESASKPMQFSSKLQEGELKLLDLTNYKERTPFRKFTFSSKPVSERSDNYDENKPLSINFDSTSSFKSSMRSMRSSDAMLKENRKANEYYKGCLQSLITQATDEKKSIENTITKKVKKLSRVLNKDFGVISPKFDQSSKPVVELGSVNKPGFLTERTRIMPKTLTSVFGR